MNARRVFARLVVSGFVIVVGLGFTSSAWAGGQGHGRYDNALGAGLYRLDGKEIALPVGDLDPLREVIGNARFVGVGEPIHTSGGFYEAKGRVFRWLVEERGFRVLAWEAPFFWLENLETYLQTCDVPAVDLLRDNLYLFNTHRSTETAELLQWMCDWNESHTHPGDKLHVFGFDVQRQALPAADALIAYLGEIGVGEEDAWVAGIRACDGVVETFFPARPFPAERYAQCQQALAEVATWFDANERTLERATSREALAWARVHLVIQEAWQTQIHFAALGDFVRFYEARDRGMAYLAEAIHGLRYRHEKVMLWAHNGHLTTAGAVYVGAVGVGDLLRERLGKDYKVLGMVGSEIFANRPQVGQCGLQDLSVPGEVAVEDLLAATGEAALLLDLRPKGGEQPLLEPGAIYAVADGVMVPAEGFDGLVYLETSAAMHPLGNPSCP